jgi:hypothetical protein
MPSLAGPEQRERGQVREQAATTERERLSPPPPGAIANILTLQRSAGNAAVAAMLGGERSAPAPTIQRSPSVEFTPSPHRVSLGETRLLPGLTPKRHSFVPAKRLQRPLAQGSFDVAGIPIGYELKADAYLDAGLGFWSAPAMLTDIELLAQGEEAERLRGLRPRLIPGLPVEAPQLERPRPRGTLEGSARLRFDAGANLDASAGAKVSGGATLADAVSAGGYGKLGGSARAAAQLHVDNMVFLTWKDGEISLRSDTIPGFWLGFELEFVIAAEAGVYVELRVPEIPVVTSLYNELNSWPGLGWILPDLDSLRWRGEYGKSWQLAARRYHHNVPLDLKIGASGIEPVVKSDAGPQPDEMLNDAGKKQREELKDDPVGPGEKRLKGDAGAMAAARAAAKAQLASTREIIDREKSVTAKLLAQARRTAAAKPASAAAGGVQMAAVDPPGGGKADDTPVEQLERRQDALADADSKRQTLETASKDLLAPAAAPDGPTRNEARVALDAVAQNADTLGDKVNSGDGDLARPTDTGNSADAPAMKELGDLEPATLALADEARDAIGTEKELLGTLATPSSAPAGRAYKDAHDAYRKAVTKAVDQWKTLEHDVKAAQSLRLSDPPDAANKFKHLGERARNLRDDAKGLAALRPQEPPPQAWFAFDAANNDAFRARLRGFRGTDDVEPNHAGGEGAIFRDGGEQRVLKRWFARAMSEMRPSVRLLKAARSEVERSPELSRLVRVVAVHEEGPDWIERDWVTAELMSGAADAQETVKQVVDALGRIDAGGGLPEALRKLRIRIRQRSQNLLWDGERLIVIDMM